MKLKDGGSYTLTLKHGETERIVTGTVRSFAQDGEKRWEIITAVLGKADVAHWISLDEGKTITEAIGFLPEHVLNAESL